MIESYLSELYSKVKFDFYKDMCRGLKDDSTLTLTEVFCAELIYSLNNPTVKEFADFIQISSPNASYKIKNLVSKGYVNKVRSSEDRREYHLEVTDKYIEKFGMRANKEEEVAEKLRKKLNKRDMKKLEDILPAIVSMDD